MTDKKLKIKELKKDGRNANRGTERGDELLSTSFEKYGAGRSILIDKENNIIAGNHAFQKAVEAGIENVIIVPTDGKTLVAVQRTDIDLNSKIGREMAIIDNTSAQANIDLDTDIIDMLHTEFEMNLDDIGVNLDDLDAADEYDEDEDDGEGSGSGPSKKDVPTIEFEVSKSVLRKWEKFKEQHGYETDGGCFMEIFNHAIKTFKK